MRPPGLSYIMHQAPTRHSEYSQDKYGIAIQDNAIQYSAFTGCEASFLQERRDVIPDFSTDVPHETIAPQLPPLACERCGVIDRPHISAGSGPHALRATCAHCGNFIQWLSRYTPAEREARRQVARAEAMAGKPPSPQQISYLQLLGYTGTCPVTMAEASAVIDALLQQTTKGPRP
jgi:hypothetical protein